MPLLNYTTTVASEKTAATIAQILAGAGARSVLTEYARAGEVAGRPCGLAFSLEGPTGVHQYRLPVDIAAVEGVLKRDRSIAARFKTREQAERVAWRILKDWVEAQVAIIATRMVAADEVFLPYMLVAPDVTVYNAFLEERLALGAGT